MSDIHTSCLAIAWTCSSGRHLSSSSTSNNSPWDEHYHLKVSQPSPIRPIDDEIAHCNQTRFMCTWANSVTTQNSWGVSKASIISIMFSCLSFLRIYIRSCGWQQKVRWYSEIRKKTAVVTSISCLRLCISLSVLPCLRMNFMATVWTETQNRRKQRVSSINYKGREWESIT